jgi:murine toxin
MSQIDNVQQNLGQYFNHLDGPNYLRLLDTPHVWGMQFGKEIMPQALTRQAEFERAVVEVMQKARYRCDLSSLNSPDPAWVRAILGAIDTALSTPMARSAPTQFRFLFGQTPVSPFMEPANYADFKAALIRLVRLRCKAWERMPEIWMGRFYRLQEGVLSALTQKLFSDSIISTDDTKMTWNHSKIIAVDGCEALAGGHNLNMDLFRSYPPVHDLSCVVHGAAAHGSQLFLNQMWECGTDLLTKECLDTASLAWINRDQDRKLPADPLREPAAASYIQQRQAALIALHQSGVQPGPDDSSETPAPSGPRDTRSDDLQTLNDLSIDVFPMRVVYTKYQLFEQYKLASRMLSVGKYWTGPKDGDYRKGSEVMKETLIKQARNKICMAQMDLVSAWKKNWSDHKVCQWVMEALQANPGLTVEVVVSPLDAGAGAEGDQYSFGSGASRTFELISYYMTHDAATDAVLDDGDGKRAAALKRIRVAPFYFTDQVPESRTGEGTTYKWPELPVEGFTATLKQAPLSEKPPREGVIGSAAMSLIRASGSVFRKVESAPGNHSKLMIIDDQAYVIGSDNLYPGSLSEFNYLVEGPDAVNALIDSYWKPLWKYSSPHGFSG